MLVHWLGLLLDKVLVKVRVKVLLVHWLVKVLVEVKVLVDGSESTLLVHWLLAAQVWLQVDSWRVWHWSRGCEGWHH